MMLEERFDGDDLAWVEMPEREEKYRSVVQTGQRVSDPGWTVIFSRPLSVEDYGQASSLCHFGSDAQVWSLLRELDQQRGVSSRVYFSHIAAGQAARSS